MTDHGSNCGDRVQRRNRAWNGLGSFWFFLLLDERVECAAYVATLESEKMAPVRRVFICHTSEFTTYPEKRSFIDAAVAAVNRAGCVPCDMKYFTARDQQPAQYCMDQVRECDVYVGIIGLRYGSPVWDRPDVSYTELEFEAACQAPAKKRLVFLLNPFVTGVPLEAFSDLEYGIRQKTLRTRLENAGVKGMGMATGRDRRRSSARVSLGRRLGCIPV